MALENLKNIFCEQKDMMMVITLNRPKNLNALNSELMSELNAVLDEVQNDNSVRVIIITGEGRAFAAGVDIGELTTLSPVGVVRYSHIIQQVFDKLEMLGKPSIAAVNGLALGGGCELALACTLRVAAESAQFGLPELGLGAIPAGEGTQRLPRLVGKGRALEIILTGRNVGSEEAFRIGLVNKVVPDGQVLEESLKLAQKIAQKAPLSVQVTLEAVRLGLDASLALGTALERLSAGIAFSTKDLREGLASFAEKRKPEFKGE